MNNILIAGVFMALVSTGAIAAKPVKPPPPPDLTPRVEALEVNVIDLQAKDSEQDGRLGNVETENSQQDARLDEIDTALGYLQPPGAGTGFIPVFVDSTGTIVGVPNPEVANLAGILVKVDGYTQVFSLSIGNFNSVIGADATYYTDETCGQNGGQAYIGVNPNGIYNPAVLPLGLALDGGYTAPDPTVTKTSVPTYSSVQSVGNCRHDFKAIMGIPATEIGQLNIVPPLRLEFR